MLPLPGAAVQPVRVVAASHPFRAAHVDLEMPEGATLAEMIEAAQLDPILHRYCHVEIDGVPVDPTKLHLIRPKAGHLVTVRAVPGKSAKKAIGGVAGGGGGAPGLGGQVR